MSTLIAGQSEIVDRNAQPGMERRREPRDQVNLRGRIKSLNPLTSTGPSTVVNVIEISRNGLKISVRRPYFPNTLVQLTMFHEVINGKVRHCTAVQGGFHVGIERTKLGF